MPPCAVGRGSAGRDLSSTTAGLSFAEASTIPQAGGIARRATADVQPGDRVLVNGACGAGGAFVVALATHAGAEVTAVDRADKGDFLREIGADRTIDFATRTGPTSATVST